MKNANGLYGRLHRIVGVLALVAVLAAGLSMDVFSIVSHADSTAKITANTAKVREEASTSSNTLASVKKGDTVTVKNQTQASDGYTWYQVVYDGTKTGYIRSDLLEVTESSAVGTGTSTAGQTTGSTSNTSAGDEAVVEVNEMQPVSAKVSGSSPVRVRQNASTTSRIVSTAQGGLAMTVNGTASGTDGNEWYRVTFISNGSEVSGFVRADYVTLDGELVAAGSAEAVEPAEPAPQETETKPAENGSTTVDGSKAWDTYYQDEIWHLVDNTSGKSYSIDQIFETVKKNNETLTQVIATNKTQQIAVVSLVILVVLLICGISVLFFKLKEAKDDAYYEKVERETVRRRTEEKPSANGAKSGSTGGNGAKGNGNGKRPAGQQADHQHTGSKRPSGQNTGGQHTNGAKGNGKRPSGQKPNGQRRPADGEGAVHRKRPEEKQSSEGRTVVPQQEGPEKHGETAAEKVQEMQADAVQENVTAEAVQETVAAEPAAQAVTEEQKNLQASFTQNIEEAAKEIAREMGDPVPAKSAEKKWKSKNFADDDEFEFQFLDWDEDQE